MASIQPWGERHTSGEQLAPVIALRHPPPPAPPIEQGKTALRFWRHSTLRAPLYWVGAHGGAGESTLAAALPGSIATDHRWPDPDHAGPAAPAVLVGRTSWQCLEATQAALAQWKSWRDTGRGAHCTLLGLVLIDDGPKRKPKTLQQFQTIVAGGAPLNPKGRPRVWTLPWVEEWRLCRQGEAPPPNQKLTDLLQQVSALTHSLL